jgi:hypothetical protein
MPIGIYGSQGPINNGGSTRIQIPDGIGAGLPQHPVYPRIQDPYIPPKPPYVAKPPEGGKIDINGIKLIGGAFPRIGPRPQEKPQPQPDPVEPYKEAPKNTPPTKTDPDPKGKDPEDPRLPTPDGPRLPVTPEPVGKQGGAGGKIGVQPPIGKPVGKPGV